MPRAFLITNKRYNTAVDYEEPCRENSPERGVCTAEGDSETDSIGFENFHQPTSPRSPAHESRSLQDADSQLPLYHACDQRKSPPSSTYSLMGSSVFRPCSQNSSLVTVIRQLMQHRSPVPDTPEPDAHVCRECGKRYSTSSNLARHRQTHRSVTDKKARKCPHCDKVYVSMPAFSMHVRTHSQGCRCPYCGKCFSRPWLLQGHIRTHTGEKPFTCPVCRKAFADKSNLRAHIQTHSSSKPYVCQRCGKAFALKSYLYKHEESSCMRVNRQQRHQQDAVLNLATAKDDRKTGGVLAERNGVILV